MGWVLRLLGGAIAGVGFIAFFLYAVQNLALALLGGLTAYLGARLVNRGRRHHVPIGLSPLADDPRPHILFLRPFDNDGAEWQMSPASSAQGFGYRGPWRQIGAIVRLLHTSEQLVARAFRHIGPLVAIGDPAEGLPRLGAIRVYAGDDEHWKRLVAELAAGASYVLLEIGRSPGIVWEVQHVVDNVKPGQLILSLPNPRISFFPPSGPRRRERKRSEAYLEFAERTTTVFPHALPTEIHGSLFMYFNEQWIPYPAYPNPQAVPPFSRLRRHPDDPKLEALDWLNSVM